MWNSLDLRFPPFILGVKSNPMKTTLKRPVAIIGYSGHAFVIVDILLSAGRLVTAYCDSAEKARNPYHLQYLGTEQEAIELLREYDYFPCIGDNRIREKVYQEMRAQLGAPISAIHPTAVISSSVHLQEGVMVAANATINPLVEIGTGVICNTSCSIDHECLIGDFAHIAPGAVLCGNVRVGKGSFVGANAVVRQGVTIGENVMIGAGTVIVKDIPDNVTVVGNPQRALSRKSASRLLAA